MRCPNYNNPYYDHDDDIDDANIIINIPIMNITITNGDGHAGGMPQEEP